MSRYQDLKRQLVDSRHGHCWKCGESELRVLEFHHLGKRRFRISRELWKIVHQCKGALAFRVLMDEVQKCAVLCKTCHAKVHARLLEV